MSDINDTDDNSKSNQRDAAGETDKRIREAKQQCKHQQRMWNRDYIIDYPSKNRKNNPENNLVNAHYCIENDQKFHDLYRYNKLKRQVMVCCGKPRPLQDTDIQAAQEYMQDFCGLSCINKETVHSAILLEANDHAYNPLQDYIGALEWDGNPRLRTLLITGFGAAPSEYNCNVGRWFAIQAVARGMNPGCKADYMLVLEGPQGQLKSTALRLLASDEFFSDHLPDIHTKDSSIHVTTHWIIEAGELHVHNRADSFHFKTWLTRQEERYRPPYGRVEECVPRPSVMVGTTNEPRYLKDQSGGRRFWPVVCTGIDIEWLTAWRDQIWAEAHYCWRSGHPYWPGREFETEHIKPEQENRRDADAWMNLVVANAGTIPDKKNTTIVQIYQTVLGMGANSLPSNAECQRIGNILRDLCCPVRRTTRGMIYDLSNVGLM